MTLKSTVKNFTRKKKKKSRKEKSEITSFKMQTGIYVHLDYSEAVITSDVCSYGAVLTPSTGAVRTTHTASCCKKLCPFWNRNKSASSCFCITNAADLAECSRGSLLGCYSHILLPQDVTGNLLHHVNSHIRQMTGRHGGHQVGQECDPVSGRWIITDSAGWSIQTCIRASH